jgi:hypothetical protein
MEFELSQPNHPSSSQPNHPSSWTKESDDPLNLLIRKEFEKLYAFGDRDPELVNSRLTLARSIARGEKTWHIVLVERPAGSPTIADLLTTTPKVRSGYAIEGPAGIGKTTLLGGKFAGGDLNELRKQPWTLLAGTRDDYSYFRLAARMMSSNGYLVDRSDWVAPLVYNAYYSGFLFLFADPDLISFISQITPYEVLMLDDDTLSDEDLHRRIQERGGMDKDMPLDYTVITREFFAVVAKHYKLRQITPGQARAIIKPFLEQDIVTHFPSFVREELLGLCKVNVRPIDNVERTSDSSS